MRSLERTPPSPPPTDPTEIARYDWTTNRRDNQKPPDGDWLTWLVLAGRGFGKTRTGAETLRMWVEQERYGRVGLIGPTAADTRDVMVQGESGLLAVSPPWFRPVYQSSLRRLTWPNGAVGTLYSADEPERLRGPQHDLIWADEPASWRYGPDTWANAMLGLRLGPDPRAIVTGTPKPVQLVRELLKARTTVVTRGSTYDNLENLAPSFRESVLSRYEGTRLGRQELLAELLEDTPGALWVPAMLEREGFRPAEHPQLERIVVAVDPAASSDPESAETGIVVAGKLGRDGFVLADRSLRGSPTEWATAAIDAFNDHRADRIVVERNNGGDMVESVIRSVWPSAPITTVWASQGKRTRAEPIAALYEQHRIHHVGPATLFTDLEGQLTGWVPGMPSPDRLDALVWALTELFERTAPVRRPQSLGFTGIS